MLKRLQTDDRQICVLQKNSLQISESKTRRTNMENQVNQHEIEAKKLQNSKDRVQKATGNRGKIITESQHGTEARSYRGQNPNMESRHDNYRMQK